MAVGQAYSPPSHAAIILSLEGVFASVASYLLLDETLSYRELSGCFLMLTAALIAKVGISCIDIKEGTDMVRTWLSSKCLTSMSLWTMIFRFSKILIL